jgi:site-specific DNA recombinase
MARRQQIAIPALFSRPSVPPSPVCSGPGVDATVRPNRTDGLAAWAAGRVRRSSRPVAGGLRFAFYWRVSTEDHQDPVTSRAWQLRRALATIGGEGRIVVEFSDVGKSRSMSPFLRPGSAALLAALADPGRGFDAVVIGSHERAFSGNQYSLVAPLLALHGVSLWMPELGGAVDPAIDTIEELMDLLGILARREVIRARQRATNAMTVQVLEQGRYEGGRVPYGYRLTDAGPHPSRGMGRRGGRIQRFYAEPTLPHTPLGSCPPAESGFSGSIRIRPRRRSCDGCSRCGCRK